MSVLTCFGCLIIIGCAVTISVSKESKTSTKEGDAVVLSEYNGLPQEDPIVTNAEMDDTLRDKQSSSAV